VGTRKKGESWNFGSITEQENLKRRDVTCTKGGFFPGGEGEGGEVAVFLKKDARPDQRPSSNFVSKEGV